MSLPEFAKDFRVRRDSDDHILASGDIVLMLYERRHQDEIEERVAREDRPAEKGQKETERNP